MTTKRSLYVLAAVAIVMIFCPIVEAATLVVTSTADSDNFECLRGAIGVAISGDVISFDLGDDATITLTEGQLDIDKNLEIRGPGATDLTIDAAGGSRVLRITSGVTVQISGITITGGDSLEDGGGIYNSGALTIRGCAVRNNTTSGYKKNGGGVYSNYSLALENCEISGNHATGYGGGVYCKEQNSTMTNCTITNNTSDFEGGGIRHDNTLHVSNCTITDNSTSRRGGGFIAVGNTIHLKNSIVANNNASIGFPDIYVSGGQIESHGFNLIEDSGDCTITPAGGLSSDIFGVDPMLGSLDYHGGETRTVALLEGSSAIDNGSSTDIDGNFVSTDQRGISRPQGSGCDIGAFELVVESSGDIEEDDEDEESDDIASDEPEPVWGAASSGGCQAGPWGPGVLLLLVPLVFLLKSGR